jgi:TonB family protein
VLEKTAQLKSNSAQVQFELGQTYLAAKKYDAAVKQYQWLEKKDKQLAVEFRLSIPSEIARQYKLPPSLLDMRQAELDAAQPIYPMTQQLRPIITYKEKAMYTVEAHDKKIQGTVVLSVVFTRQGKLIVVNVVRGLPYGLTEMAIEAARMMRFKPAMDDDRPVSVKGNVEFNFTRY